MTWSGLRCPGWLVALGMLLAVYLAGVGAVLFAPSGEPVANWWPAAGLAVSLVCLAPRRWWPALAAGVVVASGLANLTGGRDLPVSVLFGLSNAAEAVVAAAVLRRGGRRRPRLEGPEDFVNLVLAALVGGAAIATGAALTVTALGRGSFTETWPSVFASHAASTFILVPVALVTWRASEAPAGPARGLRRAELAAQLAALVAVTTTTFAPGQVLPVTFVPLPFLVWAALRFDLRTVIWQLAGLSVAATYLAAHGYGPFGAPLAAGELDALAGGLLTQGYLLCAGLMTLPLAMTVEQRGRLIQRMSASERLFRRNFTESLVGMLLLRCDGTRLEIVDLNDAAAGLLGGAQPDLVGRSLESILETPERLDLVTKRMLAGDLDGWKAQTGLCGRRGARVNVALSLLTGEPEPMFSVQLLDATEQRRHQEMLVAALDKERTAVDRLRQLDEAKNEFVSTVSHELRTPVTSIVGYTEMLQDGSVVDPLPDQLPLLRTIARNGQRLIGMCNDLLLLSGLDSGAARWERQTVDLTSLLTPAEEAVRSLLTGRDLRLRMERCAEPVEVLGDRAQLERVLLNLLSNAVKFTEDGGDIRCRLDRRDDEALLTVADTGIGIPEQEQGRLFQKFFRSSTAQARAIQGTGLGLSIVAAIVRGHGGTVEVESAHLRGTAFTVRLPLATPTVVRAPGRQATT